MLLQPPIVHSVFWLWTVQCWVRWVSKLTALEAKMCGKMMVVTSYFKNELQSLKKYNYTSNWSVRNCAVKCDSPKNRIYEDTTLLSKKFTPASDEFIQVLNISSKHWILVFWGKFGQINIRNSIVTKRKCPKTLLKVYIASQIFTALFFNCVLFQFSSKTFYWLRIICYLSCNWIFTWWKGENSSFDINLMREP